MQIHVHFMGIGGSGASAIAAIAQAQGFTVTGCDSHDPHNEFTTDFTDKQLLEGHDPTHLDGVDLVAISPAVTALDPKNGELAAATANGIPVMTWQEFMGKYLEKDKFVIAVCGTHGKSTTSAMIGLMLEDAGLDPTVEIGAVVPRWGKNYRAGQGKYFVTEADEFNDNFLVTHPDITVVTAIEMDHPEYFADEEAYLASFGKFLGQTSQLIVANLKDHNVAEVVKDVMKATSVTSVDYTKSDFGLELKVLGKHNQLNAKAAFQVGLALGLDPSKIKTSLESYRGIGRRMEHIGQWRGAEVYSDFGHHPTEIKVTVEAFKQQYPKKKIWLVFQPHMFSRTKALFNDFVKVLRDLPVETEVIVDIYPSREVDTGLVTSQELVEAIDRPGVNYAPDFKELVKAMEPTVKKDDLILMMGAGSIDQWAREMVKQ